MSPLPPCTAIRSFMEEYDPTWSPNEGDSALRYAFQNQPDVSAWNCERLAEAFASIIGEYRLIPGQSACNPPFNTGPHSVYKASEMFPLFS